MITIDLDRIKRAGAPKKVIEVYEYLKAYRDNTTRQDWEKERTANWDAIENKLWSEDELADFKKQKQLAIVDNRVRKGTQGRCAVVTDQKPEIKFHPIGSGDLYVAELCKRAHDVVWEKNEGNDVVYDACEESTISGDGVIYAYHDPNKGMFGRVVFEEYSPEDCYWDPDSRKRDWSDTHVILAKLRTPGYIKEKYPDVPDDDLYFEEQIQDEQHTSSGVTKGDNYVHAEKSERKDLDDRTGVEDETVWEIWALLRKTEHEDWVIILSEDGTAPETKQIEAQDGQNARQAAEAQGGVYWPRMRQKRVLRHIVGKKLIPQTDAEGVESEELMNPYGEDQDGDPIMPAIRIRSQRTRKGYSKGIVTYARDLNKVSSKAYMNFIHGAAHLVNAPIVRGDGSKWVGTPGTPGSEIVLDKNTPMHLVPQRLSPGAIQLEHWISVKQVADDAINDQFDMPDVMRGKVPDNQKNMSGRLGLALQDLAGMMNKPFLRGLESSLVRLVKANMAIIFRHWPRYQWERLIEPDEMENWMPEEERRNQAQMAPNESPDAEMKAQIAQRWQEALDKVCPVDPLGRPTGAGIQVMDIDIKMTAGSSMPTNRMAKLEVAIELVGAGIYDRQAALEYVDDPGKELIVARMAKQDQAMQQAEMMKMGRK